MSLSAYKKKRKLSDSPEPAGNDRKKQAGGNAKRLRFVVQRHDASRLHYDFRLEMEGVLKSWAVPKGPSLNPDDKRLAMMVEDHPYDYRNFEGVIPQGNYGAGLVQKWDEGFYEPIDKQKNPEKELLKALRAGSLKFVLKGKKLKGEFALVKMKGKEDNSWLLIKHKDRFATESPYSAEDEAPKVHIRPMLATLASSAFTRQGWIFENKWDGYRAIAEVRNGSVSLYSRNGKSFNKDYPLLTGALSKSTHDLVLDGEVVVLGKNGQPDFQLLQNYGKTKKGDTAGGTVAYYVFDLLELNGHDLKDMELLGRKELLDELFISGGDPFKPGKSKKRVVRKTDYIANKGEEYLEKIRERDGEGIIAKSGSSIYQAGKRSRQWLKIKTHRRQEAIIAGFTAPRGGRKKFGALILAVHENGKLKYIGHTGGGFNDESLKTVYDKMQPLINEQCPFEKTPKTNAAVTWLKPELVCEVKFAEWTGGGHMRQPIFIGLRDDKPAKMIVREKALATKPEKPAQPSKAEKRAPKPGKRAQQPGKTAPQGPKKGKSMKLKAGNRNITISNAKKLYWPSEKISKGSLASYYQEMAPHMMPYLKNRPQSLHRHPDGITKPGFFHKDFDLKNAPDWLKTVPVHSESNNKEINYLLCNNAATLLYMVNLGCIEINPWLSRHPRLEFPDYLAIDLDPEKISFSAVVETALAVKETLDGLKLTGFCKTSGATGLHIYVPLNRRYDFDATRIAAELIAREVHERLPKITSIIRSPAKRQKKVYVDYLQNRRGQTLAAPYSARPRPGATVSAPLDWDEVNQRLDPGQFTIHTIGERVKEKGDCWKSFSTSKNSLAWFLK